MKARFRWKGRHTVMLVVAVLIAGFIFGKDFLINKREPVDLQVDNPFKQHINTYATNVVGPYPVKAVGSKNQKVYITVSVAGEAKEYELIGVKLPEEKDFAEKALDFLRRYLKNRVVYLQAEDVSTKSHSSLSPDSANGNKRHIFVDNPRFPNGGDLDEWRIHLGLQLIKKGLALPDKKEFEQSVYSLFFYKYLKEAKDAKVGLYKFPALQTKPDSEHK